ncbi:MULTISPECIES: hypothetical protein [Kandleria]|jgi:PTS system D-glucosamine-specific IIC component|uniref:hypothetical protein n=1 Tax=Kandleria TaxID=1279388 RepID=UPI000E8BBD51|nr:hypothetical protein [Kandleria sp.]HAD23611.1 hypothetical protein [Kandleria vitulina]MBP3275737.1 PTS transporter subunit EIIB [Kandleria sp.]HAH75765.1 hypothetical protein [Kandleria vitulina]HBG67191.1 hypothetical protein [Kandleria vitulina]HCY53943.1 hypothetical protein [Kandleria vitulina]
MNSTIIIAIVAALILVALAVFFILKNKSSKEMECPIDLDRLIQALGGIDNIVDVETTPSTLKVKLKDQSQLPIDEIKALGASGIVQGADTLTMIFGKASYLIGENLRKTL